MVDSRLDGACPESPRITAHETGGSTSRRSASYGSQPDGILRAPHVGWYARVRQFEPDLELNSTHGWHGINGLRLLKAGDYDIFVVTRSID